MALWACHTIFVSKERLRERQGTWHWVLCSWSVRFMVKSSESYLGRSYAAQNLQSSQTEPDCTFITLVSSYHNLKNEVYCTHSFIPLCLSVYYFR